MALEMALAEPMAIPIVAILSVFVFFPLAIGVARLIWKRASEPPRRALTDDTALRLERLQQAVDAMAIEVERISEGQRFMTKVLAEKNPAALPRDRGATLNNS